MINTKRVLFVVGPTGCGKTALSIELARRFKGEIISADSMQVYERMDIGTDKVSRALRQEIPHHLIDIRKPSQEFSVHEYREEALKTIESIVSRAHLPIIVGGSGLYVKAVLHGIDPAPGASASFREMLAEEVRTKGLAHLYERALAVAPERAKKIHPNDERRIIRLLEIHQGNTASTRDLHVEQTSLASLGYEWLTVGLMRERNTLYALVEERVDLMIDRGLFDEVRALMGSFSKTTEQAVGYKEIVSFFKEECSREEAIANIKKNTRHLVKKQYTWFRAQTDIQWLDLDVLGSPDAVLSAAERLVKRWMGV